VFVLSGPSGVGKSTLIQELKRDGFPITYCVTATTRARRPGEVHGAHYYFLGQDEFERLVWKGQFLEHATVHQVYRYGIPLFSVREGLRQGTDLIMTPEVQGAATVRRLLPQAVTIFLRPESIEELVPRLEARGSESPEERRRRLQTAEAEMGRQQEYEYVVVNRSARLHEAIEDVKSIIRAERLRTNPRTITV
jgi:guanylate kinase